MGILDGVISLFKRGVPTENATDASELLMWIEEIGPDLILRSKDSLGVVKNIGSAGTASTFPWMLQAGSSNLPSNGTETGFSYGNNSANDGVTMMRDGFIKALSVRVEPQRTAGTAVFFINKNNIQNNVLGQRVAIDGSVNAEGGLSTTAGLLIFPVPFAYSAGDQIELRAVTSGWSPTSADCSVLVHMEDTL